MRPLLDALRPIPGAFFRELRALTWHGPRAREPLKAVLSVLLAVTVAAILQLDDLSWAAFSGYMVMRADIAESIPRGLMRTAGTLGGALVGLLLAPTVGNTPVLLMLGLFVVSWIGSFQALTSRYSYAWLFFGLTAGIVMTEALADPGNVVHFAGTIVAEIIVEYSASCLVVASLFAAAGSPAGTGAPRNPASIKSVHPESAMHSRRRGCGSTDHCLSIARAQPWRWVFCLWSGDGSRSRILHKPRSRHTSS